tara:strand:+ start:42 stop:551 length:510 start_codon:yes stop_codon:yes gene_type:complete
MTVKRKFNKEAYERSKHAENRVISHLKDHFKIENLGSTYDEDLRIYSKQGDYLCNADIEVRFKWKQKYFPFYSVHIPIRKRKFIKTDKPFFYFAVNSDGTDCLVTHSKHILSSQIVPLTLTYSYGIVKEDFFDVPLTKWKQGFDQLPNYISEHLRKHKIEQKQTKLDSF